LKILTFASLFPNSSDLTQGIFIYQRSLHLAKRQGNEVQVVAPIPYVPQWLKVSRWHRVGQVPEREEIGGLIVHHPRYFLLPKVSMPWHALSMFLGCLSQVKSLHRHWKIDCVDAHFVYPDGLAAVLLGKYLGLPVTVSARGTDINVYPGYRLIRPMIRWALEHADGVIAVSSALKDVILGLKVDNPRIRVVPNGVDPSCFYPTASGEARQILNLPKEGPVIVSVGSLIPSKGHHLLVHVFSQIAPRHKGLRLYILGEGPERPELERLIEKLDLQKSVFILGKRPNSELRMWFSAATLSCLLSSREGWPNVVTESLACGTPVVASYAGGIPEIIHSPELGVLVEQTVEAAAAGLERALAKEWNREAISRETRARTWDQVVTEVENVFREELATRRAR
jgi:teichuronic acid biosynthesis glycosyltransferase TuaC